MSGCSGVVVVDQTAHPLRDLRVHLVGVAAQPPISRQERVRFGKGVKQFVRIGVEQVVVTDGHVAVTIPVVAVEEVHELGA